MQQQISTEKVKSEIGRPALSPVNAVLSTNKRRSKQTNYNPGLKPALLERLFGYKRQTFRSWESDKRDPEKTSGPILYPNIFENRRNHQKPLREYTVRDVSQIYKWLKSTGHKIPEVPSPITISVWNNKGGVGKTTFVQHLASTFSILMGLKVLVIDTDSQGCLTNAMDCEEEFENILDDTENVFQPTIRDVIGFEEKKLGESDYKEVKKNLDEAIIDLSPTLSVIPADADVSDLDYDLKLLTKKYFNEKGQDVSQLASIDEIRKKIIDNSEYDIIMFDCAPNKGLLNLNVLYATDVLVLPIETDARCIHSINRVKGFLDLISGQVSEKFVMKKVLGVPNKFSTSKNIKKKALGKLEEIFGDTILSNSILPDVTVIDDATDEKIPIFIKAMDSSSNSNSKIAAKKISNEFWMLAHEIIDMVPEHMIFPDVSEFEEVEEKNKG